MRQLTLTSIFWLKCQKKENKMPLRIQHFVFKTLRYEGNIKKFCLYFMMWNSEEFFIYNMDEYRKKDKCKLNPYKEIRLEL